MSALPAQSDKLQPPITIPSFEAGTIDPKLFDHETHVYLGWLYLQDCELQEAIGRFCSSLKRLTAKLGIKSNYHETITWFFLIVINERLQRYKTRDWHTFRQTNSDLFATRPSIIRRHYSPERLNTTLARAQFLLPDLPSS